MTACDDNAVMMSELVYPWSAVPISTVSGAGYSVLGDEMTAGLTEATRLHRKRPITMADYIRLARDLSDAAECGRHIGVHSKYAQALLDAPRFDEQNEVQFATASVLVRHAVIQDSSLALDVQDNATRRLKEACLHWMNHAEDLLRSRRGSVSRAELRQILSTLNVMRTHTTVNDAVLDVHMIRLCNMLVTTPETELGEAMKSSLLGTYQSAHTALRRLKGADDPAPQAVLDALARIADIHAAPLALAVRERLSLAAHE